jgi:hypothetical protein
MLQQGAGLRQHGLHDAVAGSVISSVRERGERWSVL